MDIQLVPNRECGACTVCCELPAILDPALRKAPGVRCPNCLQQGGCGIYETRPETCRGHYCAWRCLAQFDESWRPDLSKVYIELKSDPPEKYRHEFPDAPFAIRFTLLGDLDPPRLGLLATTIASLVQSDVPVILSIAPPPGHLGSRILLNKGLKPFATNPGLPFLEAFAKALHTLQATPPEKVAL